MKQSVEENQLALLYLLQHLQRDVRENEIVHIFTDLDLMNYIEMREALYLLLSAKQIKEVPDMTGISYRITDSGIQSVEALKTDLRRSVRDAIETYVSENKEKLDRSAAYLASYTRLLDGTYRADAKIVSDGLTVFQMSFTLDNLEDAKMFSQKWPEKGKELYQKILVDLTI